MLKLTLTASSEQVESVVELLTEHGAAAISFEDKGDQAIFQNFPNEVPLWQKIKVQALFYSETDLLQIIAALSTSVAQQLDYEISQQIDQDWIEAGQKNFPLQHFAQRLWVCPSWEETKGLSGAIVRLNPGLGFGTGAHPTTALCLTWLAQQSLTDQVVIDYGCGSGILALAACALGAKTVWAVDHDPQALMATHNNAELNLFPNSQLHIVAPEQLPLIKADILLANILANPLCELANELQSRVISTGRLVLSGFLNPEKIRVEQAYPNMQVVSVEEKEQWVRLVMAWNL